MKSLRRNVGKLQKKLGAQGQILAVLLVLAGAYIFLQLQPYQIGTGMSLSILAGSTRPLQIQVTTENTGMFRRYIL